MRDSARTPKAAGPAAIAAVALAAAAALALPALLAPPVAQAAAPVKIAGWGQGAGKVNNPVGVAVNQSNGDFYVADLNNFRVNRFGPDGDFQLAWGYGVADGKTEELQVCGPEAPTPTKRCSAGLHGAAGEISPQSVAVEHSTGDVYVAELSGRRVSKFTPDGLFLFTIGKDVNKTKVAEGAPQAERDICIAASGDACGEGKSGTGPGEFESPRSLAFDGAGGLWVNDNGKRAQRFDSSGAFIEEVALPSGTQSSALVIDAGSGDFYVLGPQGHNESQYVGNVPGATFALSFEGETTHSITFGPHSGGSVGYEAEQIEAVEAIQKALEALPAIGKGNVSVEGYGPFDYLVTFIHDLGGRDVPQLTASGGSPPVTVTTATQGNPGSVRKLDPAGALLETLDDEEGDIPRALATDAAGNLYVGDGGVPYHFLRYDHEGNLTSVFGAGQVLGEPAGNAIAIDEARGYLYAASSGSAQAREGAAAQAQVAVQRFGLPEPGPLPEDERAEDVLPTSATLAAELNPEGHQTTYFFEYGTSDAYGESTPVQTLGAEGFDPEAVEAQLEGLLPETTYHFRLVANSHCNEAEPAEECIVGGEDTTFATRSAVGIEAQWASDLSAHDATLNARLDPLGVKGEWWLEYDTSPYAEGQPGHGTSVPVPHGALPASFGEVPATVALGGLEPATTYHYRFVAKDEREVKEGGGTVKRAFTTYGPDQSFTTQLASLGFVLPDGRAWEMASPPDKHGGRIAPFDGAQGGQVQAAANGEALAYLSYGSLEADPAGNRIIEQSSELAKRAAGGAWSTTDITPPHASVTNFGAGSGLEYKLFSTNLERSLLEPRECTALSPATTERTPYVRDNTEPPGYTPLVTAADVEAGTHFGGDCSKLLSPVNVRGASPDLSHVVLVSSVPLAAGAAPESLYEWSAGSLRPISVLPKGGGAVNAELGSGESSVHGAVSADGSRIFWSAGGLYVRDTAHDETFRLDEEQEGAFGTGAIAPSFQAASADGSLAFFTDTQNLTEDANEEGADLYRWITPDTHGCEEEAGCLEDLSAGVANTGESAEVEGLLPGFAADGSAAYLIARGVLATNVVNHGAGPEEARPGQPNLYLWREGEGTRFVARLSGQDGNDWEIPRLHTAAASPSGRYLAFMSARPLSGYDNRALGSGEPAQEVFRYDSVTEELTCASCEPSGARPRAWLQGAERRPEEEALDPEQVWGTVGQGWHSTVAALVPEGSWVGSDHAPSLYTPRYVQDDGRVFFDAAGPLVAADSNGSGDVYEYEPTGAGSCTASAGGSGTATVPGGCVSLLSSGTAEGTSAFLDASAGARDVFFYSPARLSVTDVNGELDVYDAREGGEPAKLEPLAECQGEACQPPAVPPVTQTPASAAFRGPGNLSEAPSGRRPCPQGKRRVGKGGNARCAKQHKKGKKHTKKRDDPYRGGSR